MASLSVQARDRALQRAKVGSFVHIIDDLARGDTLPASVTREQGAELAEERRSVSWGVFR